MAQILWPSVDRIENELAQSEGARRIIRGDEVSYAVQVEKSVVYSHLSELFAWPIEEAHQTEKIGERVWPALPLPPTVDHYLVGPDGISEATERRREDDTLSGSGGRCLRHSQS